MKNILNTRLRKNVSWIFIGNVLHSLLGLLFGMYVARKLSLNDNGLVQYASSVTAFVSCIVGLGFSSLITREFAAHEEDAGDYLCSCILTQCGTGTIAILLLQIFVTITSPDEPVLRWLILANSLSMVLGSPNILVYWFRYNNRADKVAVVRLLAFCLCAVVKVVVLEMELGMIAYIYSSLVETLLFSLFLIKMYREQKCRSFRYSFKIVKSMVKVSYPFIFSALLVTIYAQTDKVMIKSLMDNESVALYTVAAHLAGAISSIPSTLIEGFRPEVMESRIKDRSLYLKRFRQLYAIVFWASIAYCLVVSVFSRQILVILYSKKYLGAVDALALVVWYSAFSYMGSINNMYMVAEDKQIWVTITTLIGALANVICNYAFIPIWGIMGAALASLITQFFANFVTFGLIPSLRPGFKLMLQGILLKDVGLKELVSEFRKK